MAKAKPRKRPLKTSARTKQTARMPKKKTSSSRAPRRVFTIIVEDYDEDIVVQKKSNPISKKGRNTKPPRN